MTTLLALDTSGPSVSVAIERDGLCLAECTLQTGLTHSQSLMPMVERALTEASVSLRNITGVACVVGPGSFTGVRIGVGTAKALGQARDIPCIGVNALEAYAAGLYAFEGVVCPIQDARAGQVYGAAFRTGEVPERLLPDMAEKLEKYLESVRPLGDRFLFTGDGVSKLREQIETEMGEAACFAPAPLRVLRASSVAHLAAQRLSEARPYYELVPLYLRAPQAERERLAREAAEADG